MSPRPIDALGGVPGAHLGLGWAPTTMADLPDVVELSRRCEDADGAQVRVPAVVVERTLTGTPADSVSMIGRDRSGAARACASVRIGPTGTQVALRALVDPPWRGRGVGRAVLGWQDRWARHFLGETTPSTIAVPIAATLIDGRRLYTAAGFSCRARVEVHSRHLGDALAGERHIVPFSPAPGWRIRSLRPGDDVLAENAGPDPYDFVAAAMTVHELMDTCEPTLSLVAEHNGVPTAGVLVHPTTDSHGRPVGWTRALFAEPGAEMAPHLLGAVFREMWASGLRNVHLYTTPAVSVRWRDVFADLACEPVDVELLYSIETA